MATKNEIFTKAMNNGGKIILADLYNGENKADKENAKCNLTSFYNVFAKSNDLCLAYFLKEYAKQARQNKGTKAIAEKAVKHLADNGIECDVTDISKMYAILEKIRNTNVFTYCDGSKEMVKHVDMFIDYSNEKNALATAKLLVKTLVQSMAVSYGDFGYNNMHNNELSKLAKNAIKDAQHGRSKAMENKISKILELESTFNVDAIRIQLVNEILPTSETPINTNTNTEKTA